MPRLIRCQRCRGLHSRDTPCECMAAEPPRDSSTDRGYDGWWRKYSQDYRRRNPYCVACAAKGIATPTCMVDHIVPFHGPDGSIDESLRRDPDNHQSLCDHRYRDCHGKIKKPLEEKWRGNPERLRIEWIRLLGRLAKEAVQ